MNFRFFHFSSLDDSAFAFVLLKMLLASKIIYFYLFTTFIIAEFLFLISNKKGTFFQEKNLHFKIIPASIVLCVLFTLCNTSVISLRKKETIAREFFYNFAASIYYSSRGGRAIDKKIVAFIKQPEELKKIRDLLHDKDIFGYRYPLCGNNV